MAKLSALRTDPTKEISGVWVDYDDGIKLLIARLNNPNYEKFITDRQNPNIGKYRVRKQSNAEIETLVMEAVAHTVLLGWQNVDDDEGKPLAFSPKAALGYFKDPSYRDFYKFVLFTANSQEQYMAESKEQAAGN